MQAVSSRQSNLAIRQRCYVPPRTNLSEEIIDGVIDVGIALNGTRQEDVPTGAHGWTEPQTGPTPLTMVLAGRDDSFIPYLRDGLSRRFDVVGTVDAERSQWQRLATAAVTFRPSRRAWVERFFKSQLAISFRSANARRALARVEREHE